MLVAAAVGLVTAGGDVLLAGLLLVSLVGQFELYRIFGMEKSLAGGIGYLGAVLYYLDLRLSFLPSFEVFMLGLLVLLMAVYVFAFPKYQADQVFAAFGGVFYVPVMLAGIYQARALPAGAYLVWLIFLCSWGCDTCAYCVGVRIGKHKMTPKLSPKKSVVDVFVSLHTEHSSVFVPGLPQVAVVEITFQSWAPVAGMGSSFVSLHPATVQA